MAITISGNGIVEANLADNAVTLAKMASGTDGEILTYDASGNPVAVSVGTDGQVLTSTGAGSPPAFETAAGATSLNGLSDTTVSSSDPTISTNPSAVGHLWVNSASGEQYICTDITTNDNVWTNTGDGSGNIAQTQVATFDLFGDSSAKLLYQLENNVLDTGGTYDGTNTSTTFSSGKFGQAAVFNGSTSQVSIPTSAFAPNVDTVSFWFKLSNTSDTGKIIFYSASSGSRYYISQNGADLMFRNPDNSNQTSWGASLSAGTWYHAVLVKDADAHRKGYINGTLELDAAFPNISSTPTNVNLGSAAFTGSIDQVRIFNRALSSAEVTTLYTETNT